MVETDQSAYRCSAYRELAKVVGCPAVAPCRQHTVPKRVLRQLFQTPPDRARRNLGRYRDRRDPGTRAARQPGLRWQALPARGTRAETEIGNRQLSSYSGTLVARRMVEFAPDSLLEGTGFEPLVPGR